MLAIIPDNIISEIQSRINIVDIISEVVLLKKTGMNYVGLCPFHSEKTPSFSVSPEKQMFYCFGCGVGGNVFSFLMKHEGLSFVDAIQTLAAKCGVQIPESIYTSEQIHRKSERQQILSINRQAMVFYQNKLNDSSGSQAIQYLTKRGVDSSIMDRFQLGFAPNEWDGLTSFLAQQNIALEYAEKAGLIISKGKSGYYDRFRNRIMFPIMNARSEIIGFGGRVMDDSLPKYLNSPETPVYNKSRSLYGLNHAKLKCREIGYVYIVEGYFDLITMHMFGFENTVATLGTALTPDHIRMLKGYCDRMIMVYDSDTAGIKAAQRSIDIFRRENVDVYFLILPEGHDPDTFLFQYGADAFIQTASNALSVMTFLLECAIRKHGLSTDGKIRIVDELSKTLESIQDPLAISLYVKEISERIGVKEHVILDKIKTHIPKVQKIDLVDSGQKTNKNQMERQIISMMLHFPMMIPEIKKRNCLDFFQDSSLKAIGMAILNYHNFSEDCIPGLINTIQDETQKNMIVSLAVGASEMNNKELWKIDGCMMLLDQFEFCHHRPLSEWSKVIKAAEASNNIELRQQTLEDLNLYLKGIRERQLQVREKKTIT